MGEAGKVDLNELWQIAVDRALSKYAGDFARRQIESLLEKAGGDAVKAVQLMGDHSVTDASRLLGNWGASCKRYRVGCWGNAARHPVEAWIGPNHWDRPPDLVIQWKEIFQYVAGIHQPRLF